MPTPSDSSKYRAAIDVLQKGRDVLVEAMTEEILDRDEEFAAGGFLFQEFLETQGTRLHFLSLLVAQLEQSAEMAEESPRTVVCLVKPVETDSESDLELELEPELDLDLPFAPERKPAPDVEPTAAPHDSNARVEPIESASTKPKRRRGRPRAKKLQETSAEGRADEA